MEAYREGDIEVVRIGPLGPYGNNAYIIADTGARQSLVVDMPAEGEKILEALADARVTSIVATHWHPDHWMSYDLIRSATGAPVYVHENEIRVPPERIDARVRDGQELTVGSARVRVIHTPGHTPGSICLLLGKVLLTGDTLFPGGPGNTTFPGGDFSTIIASLDDKLFRLPAETVVMPGHGDSTTIGNERPHLQEWIDRGW